MLRFFEENNISLHLSDLHIIEQRKTADHTIELYRHKLLGKILIIDNEIQHVEAWQPLYHESLIHIPASFVGDLNTALIFGGGSFFAAAELLKYESIKKIIMVDYDDAVIEVVGNHYEHVKTVRLDPRFTLIQQDMLQFIESCNDTFDLIVNDAIDIIGHGDSLYDRLCDLLTNEGVCGDVIYRHIFEKEKSQKTIQKLTEKYNCAFSLVTIPEYPGILHLLTTWSKHADVSQYAKAVSNTIQRSWLKSKKSPCEIFSPEFISYYLHLPPYLKKWINF